MKPKFLFLFLFSFVFLSLVSAAASIGNIPDMHLTYDDYGSVDVSDYATGYDDDSTVVSFINPDTGTLVYLWGDTGGENQNSYFNIALSVGGLIQVESKSKDLNGRAITVSVGNSFTTEDNDVFLIFVEQQPPTQIASILPISLSSSGSATRTMSNYFNNYDTINVTYTDPVAGVISLERSKGQSLVSNTSGKVNVTLSTSSSNIFLSVTSKGQAYSGTWTITASNNEGEVSTTIGVSTTAAAGTAIQQIASIPNFYMVYPSRDLYLDGSSVSFGYFLSMQNYFSTPGTSVVNANISFYNASGFYLGSLLGNNSVDGQASYGYLVSAGNWRWHQGFESDTDWYNFIYSYSSLPSGLSLPYVLTIKYNLTNSVNSVQASFNVTLYPSTGYVPDVPVQIATIAPVTMAPNSVHFFNPLDFFTDFENITISISGEPSITVDTSLSNDYAQISTDDISLELTRATDGVYYLVITSKDSYFSEVVSVNVSNSEGSASSSFLLTVEGYGVSSGDGNRLVDIFSNIFPDAAGLSFGEKMVYVFVSFVVTILALFALGSAARIDPSVSAYLLIFFAFLEFIYFTAIGYIPIGIFVFFAFVSILYTFLKVRGK